MNKRLVQQFTTSTDEMLKAMTDISLEHIGEPETLTEDFHSLGVTAIISFSGKLPGRFVFNTSPSLAMAIVSKLTGETMLDPKDRLFLAGISELANVIAGDANAVLNDDFNLKLRLAPPTVFTGRDAVVLTAKMESVSIPCSTAYGKLLLHLGIQGG